MLIESIIFITPLSNLKYPPVLQMNEIHYIKPIPKVSLNMNHENILTQLSSTDPVIIMITGIFKHTQ